MDRLLQSFFRTFIRSGQVEIRTASGRTFACGDGTGPEVGVAFRDPSAESRFLLDPTLAFGELYMDDAIEIYRGDLYGAVETGLRNLDPANSSRWIRVLERLRFAVRGLAQRNDARRARANVSRHYDIGNALYELFLDPDMQYSCAYFERPGIGLAEAQLAKKRHIAAKALVDPGCRVLDIGCGWGGMALYLARTCEAQAVGVTLSRAQLDRARGRAAAEGLDVDFRLEDYRHLDETFDRIVSVGMLEHVGAPQFETYFRQVARLLEPSGVALIHTIGRPEGPGVTNPWISKHIFPGGYIPALSELAPAIEKSGLLIGDVEVLRVHYADTLKAWRERFMARRAEAAAMHDERFCRMWEFYLAGSEAGFRLGQQVVYQFQLMKDVNAVPLTRDYVGERERALRVREGASRRYLLAGE